MGMNGEEVILKKMVTNFKVGDPRSVVAMRTENWNRTEHGGES